MTDGRFVILQENLKRAVEVVERVIDARPPLPVLSNVLLDADGSNLRVAASNLQHSLSIWVGAKTDVPFKTTLPADFLKRVVSNMPKERIDVDYEAATATLTLAAGTKKGTVKGIAETEYPPIKSVEQGTVIEIAPKVLKRLIQETIFAAAREDNRPVLTGINFVIEGQTIMAAAADGYRLAVSYGTLIEALPTGERYDVNVPLRAMKDLFDLIDLKTDRETVKFRFRIAPKPLPEQAVFDDLATFVFANGSIELTTQLIEGRYPDYAAIIPTERYDDAVMHVKTADLLKAIKFAAEAAKEDAHSVRFTGKAVDRMHGTLTIAGRSAERGGLEDTLDVAYTGFAHVDVHMDSRFPVEWLKMLEKNKDTYKEVIVRIRPGRNKANDLIPESDSPIVFRVVGAETDLVYVVMPMTR